MHSAESPVGTKDGEQSSQTPRASLTIRYPVNDPRRGFRVVMDSEQRAPEAGKGGGGGRPSTYDMCTDYRIHNASVFFFIISPNRQRRAKMRPFLTVVNQTTKPHWEQAIALLMSPPWEISKISPQRSIWRSWGVRSRIKDARGLVIQAFRFARTHATQPPVRRSHPREIMGRGWGGGWGPFAFSAHALAWQGSLFSDRRQGNT